MKDILKQLSDYAAVRVEEQKKRIPTETIRRDAESLRADGGFPFRQALSGDRMHFICECKKASPSQGLISPDFPYLKLAESYEKNGADAISVLTEPKWFLGSDRYLQEIAENVRIPVLRKDFIVDPYMIYQAKLLGASAVLLICSILSEEQLKEYLELAHSLGLSALVEAHDAEEIRKAVRAGAGIIGVNNRNLRDFSVDLHHSAQYLEIIPDSAVFVAESGINGPEDAAFYYRSGVRAVLIGTYLAGSDDPAGRLRELKAACHD